MNMKKSLIKNLWMLLLLIILCGCTQIFSKDSSVEEFLSTKSERKESLLRDGRQNESAILASTDWFIYDREFYVREGEDIYEKGDFPKAVQYVLQERGNTYFYLKKVENKLVIESEFSFFIYDFGTNCMEEYNSEYGHLGWQISQNMIYFIENTNNSQTKLMKYDMASGNVNEIDTGEYMPIQFWVRQDGAIGMWGKNAKGDKEYCFWESRMPIYVPDKDEYFGWTNLCGFTERGIILEREYSTSSLRGTKIYEITKEGEISILAGIINQDNLRAIPEENLILKIIGLLLLIC